MERRKILGESLTLLWVSIIEIECLFQSIFDLSFDSIFLDKKHFFFFFFFFFLLNSWKCLTLQYNLREYLSFSLNITPTPPRTLYFYCSINILAEICYHTTVKVTNRQKKHNRTTTHTGFLANVCLMSLTKDMSCVATCLVERVHMALYLSNTWLMLGKGLF